MSDMRNAGEALGLPRGSEHVEGVHDVERLETDAGLCRFNRWRADRCTKRSVAVTSTIAACEEHMRAYEEICKAECGDARVHWRRIDGGAVALVLVVLGFLLCPGCSTAAAQVAPSSETRDIVEIVCATVLGLAVLALIGWSRGWLRSDARARARDCDCDCDWDCPHDYTCHRCDRRWTSWCSGCEEPTCDVHACGCDDEDGAK